MSTLAHELPPLPHRLRLLDPCLSPTPSNHRYYLPRQRATSEDYDCLQEEAFFRRVSRTLCSPYMVQNRNRISNTWSKTIYLKSKSLETNCISAERRSERGMANCGSAVTEKNRAFPAYQQSSMSS